MAEIILKESGANIPAIKIYPDKFEGQIVVVTGAAQGIGEATALLFARQGATVVLADIQADKLEQVVSEIKLDGGRAVSRTIDISDEHQCKDLIEWTVSQYTKIDALVQLAAYVAFQTIENHPTSSYQRSMQVNVDSCFYLVRATLPHMRKQGYGRFINTASATLQKPGIGLHVYMGSKGAVVALTRSLAFEAGAGITANVVMPGFTATDAARAADKALREFKGRSLFEDHVEGQCVKRGGQPDDLAHTICFIASPEASFITGQIFDVSGGYTFH